MNADRRKAEDEAVANIEAALAAGPTPGPWEDRLPAWWKPKDYRSNLVKSGALILAELERLDRAALAKEPQR